MSDLLWHYFPKHRQKRNAASHISFNNVKTIFRQQLYSALESIPLYMGIILYATGFIIKVPFYQFPS